MAVITSSTFDPLKARVNVRLQQGVPIVDADWNELDDIRKFELRAYLKWFVGDGIPDGSNAFAIDAITPAVADDFIIRAGVAAAPPGTTNYEQGLRFTGRGIVDGLDVVIAADINYRAQALFTAGGLGVPQITPMPSGAGPVAVYLDVWERLVTSQEDPSLVLGGLGTESCSRIKREWCVRTRAGSSAPASTDADFIAGHSYYLLSTILRQSNLIVPAGITDRREKRLLVPPATLLEDLFGVSTGQYRRGEGRPAISFRDAINSVLPTRPVVVGPIDVLTGDPHNTPAAVIDNLGVPWVFWIRNAGANHFLSFTRRIGGAWTPAQDAFQITGVLNVQGLAAAAQSDGTIRVFYVAQIGNRRLFSRRFDGSAWQAEEVIASTNENTQVTAAVDPAGTIVVAWQQSTGATFAAMSRRYPLGGSPTAIETAGTLTKLADALALTVDPTGAPQLVAVQSPSPLGPDWSVISKRLVGGVWDATFSTLPATLPVTSFIDLTVGYGVDGTLLAFYATAGDGGNNKLKTKRLVSGSAEARDLPPVNQQARFPTLVIDSQGNAQLYFQNGVNGVDLQQISFVQQV
jgi:hypothetical protein